MIVEYSKRALADLHQIATYHRDSDDPERGDRVGPAIHELILRIAAAPERGRPSRNDPASG